MVVLMSGKTSAGEVGRCDNRCYNARLPDCGCICGGMNHGKGLKEAMQWTREKGEEMAQKNGIVVSPPLF